MLHAHRGGADSHQDEQTVPTEFGDQYLLEVNE